MAVSSLRFAFEDSFESFIEEQKNQNTVEQTKLDLALLLSFLQTKEEARFSAAIPPNELNGYFSEFVLNTQNLIMYEIRKLHHGKCLDDFNSLVALYQNTHPLEDSLVRVLTLRNL